MRAPVSTALVLSHMNIRGCWLSTGGSLPSTSPILSDRRLLHPTRWGIPVWHPSYIEPLMVALTHTESGFSRHIYDGMLTTSSFKS